MTEEDFKKAFLQLLILFPSSSSFIAKDDEFLKLSMKVWIKGLHENGITEIEQIQHGLREARMGGHRFFPSLCDFVGWCKVGYAKSQGLPNLKRAKEILSIMVRDYERAEKTCSKEEIAIMRKIYSRMKLERWLEVDVDRKIKSVLNDEIDNSEKLKLLNKQ